MGRRFEPVVFAFELVPDSSGPAASDPEDLAAGVLTHLTESERDAVHVRAVHVLEILTGRADAAELAGPGEPRLGLRLTSGCCTVRVRISYRQPNRSRHSLVDSLAQHSGVQQRRKTFLPRRGTEVIRWPRIDGYSSRRRSRPGTRC